MKKKSVTKEYFKIGELAKLCGLSERALRHYDSIGLLKPSGHTVSGYREYHRSDLLRLQQVLFYRELGLELKEILRILSAENFDIVAALKDHRSKLVHRKQRIDQLISTVDRTIGSFTNKEIIMKDHEYYEGFISQEKCEEYNREAGEKYGREKVNESWKNIRKMGKPAFQELLKQGEEINRKLVELMHLKPEGAEVQILIKQHYDYIGHFYEATPEIYSGLAEMYTTDERFKAYYEKFAPGLASFLAAGMKAFLRRSENR